MNKILHLQHCTNLTTIIKILEDGYIRSAKDVQSNHIFTMYNSNISKLSLGFYNVPTLWHYAGGRSGGCRGTTSIVPNNCKI